MSVYVDNLNQWGSSASPKCFRNQKSCHMWADTKEELDKMAIKIGMKLTWFQNNRDFPHYDLVPSKRNLAVKFGAIEADRYDMVNYMRIRRGQKPYEKPIHL